MFLDGVLKNNRELVNCAVELSQNYLIRPDTFIVDVDQFVKNATQMLQVAQKKDIALFFMMKQLGRNPLLAQKLVKIGYPGAVVVDFKEAEVLMQYKIPICNVGHLVQVPNYLIEKLLNYGVDYFTVVSIDKTKTINDLAKEKGIVQNIMLRVVADEDLLYSGQMEGIVLSELLKFIVQIQDCKNIRIAALTVFPAILFDEKKRNFVATNNLKTLKEAQELLKSEGILITELNVPSATCTASLPIIEEFKGTMGEPGHGLTGTTPGHASLELEEKIAVVYVSEISHTFKRHSYFYGGGYYRRGRWKNAYVVDSKGKKTIDEVILPNFDSIDYYIGLQGNYAVGDIVISAFRFQMFTSRSDIVLVEGIAEGKPKIIGRYGPLGEKL